MGKDSSGQGKGLRTDSAANRSDVLSVTETAEGLEVERYRAPTPPSCPICSKGDKVVKCLVVPTPVADGYYYYKCSTDGCVFRGKRMRETFMEVLQRDKRRDGNNVAAARPELGDVG